MWSTFLWYVFTWFTEQYLCSCFNKVLPLHFDLKLACFKNHHPLLTFSACCSWHSWLQLACVWSAFSVVASKNPMKHPLREAVPICARIYKTIFLNCFTFRISFNLCPCFLWLKYYHCFIIKWFFSDSNWAQLPGFRPVQKKPNILDIGSNNRTGSPSGSELMQSAGCNFWSPTWPGNRLPKGPSALEPSRILHSPNKGLFWVLPIPQLRWQITRVDFLDSGFKVMELPPPREMTQSLLLGNF